ncbi:MAG: DUF2884 family protein [Alteromonadaceae bacterium]|nr:DUF2884 family protein [Alteromonadaceae bacterium]
MLRIGVLLLFLATFNVNADLKCDVDLNYGLVVTEGHIRVINESQTLYQINGDDQLIVGGYWIKLEQPQAEKIKQLSNGIHYAVPKMIILATEGVDLAIETVENVYTGLVGTDSKSFEKLKKSLEKAKKKVRSKFIHSYENYYIGPGSLENVDSLVDQELEEQIEQAINTSLGGILSAIGGLEAGNNSTMEDKIEDLSQRLEEMGEEIERTVGPRTDSLRKKARWFCKKMQRLNDIEEQLRQEVPELADINVILVGEKSKYSMKH